MSVLTSNILLRSSFTLDKINNHWGVGPRLLLYNSGCNEYNYRSLRRSDDINATPSGWVLKSAGHNDRQSSHLQGAELLVHPRRKPLKYLKALRWHQPPERKCDEFVMLEGRNRLSALLFHTLFHSIHFRAYDTAPVLTQEERTSISAWALFHLWIYAFWSSCKNRDTPWRQGSDDAVDSISHIYTRPSYTRQIH